MLCHGGRQGAQASCLTARVTSYWLLLPLELPVTGDMCTMNSAGLHHALLLQPDLDVPALRLVHELERVRPEQQRAGRCDNLKLKFQQKDLDTDEWETVETLGQVSLHV